MAVGLDGNEGGCTNALQEVRLEENVTPETIVAQRCGVLCCVALRCAVSWWRAWKYAVRRATCESINAMKNLSSCKRDASPDRPCPVKGKPSHVRCIILDGWEVKINAHARPLQILVKVTVEHRMCAASHVWFASKQHGCRMFAIRNGMHIQATGLRWWVL